MTPYGAIEKNLGFSEGLLTCPDEQKCPVFKDLKPFKHTKIMKTIFFALMWQVNSRTRGQGP